MCIGGLWYFPALVMALACCFSLNFLGDGLA